MIFQAPYRQIMNCTFFATILFASALYGQDSLEYTLEVEPIEWKEIVDWRPDTSYTDKESIELDLSHLLRELRHVGYVEASIDDVSGDERLKARLHLGQQWHWGLIEIDETDAAWFDEAALLKVRRGQRFHLDELNRIFEKALDKLSNHGYPFSEIYISEPRIANSEMSGKVKVKKRDKILFDEIRIFGTSRLKSGMLSRYLGWKKGRAYSHEAFKNVKKKVNELPYVKLAVAPKVRFNFDRAILELVLNKKKANKFDFLLGILPASDFQDRGTLLSVLLNMELFNSIGLGERIYVDFKNTKPKTQELELAFNYPYVLETPFGLDAELELFKNEESFLDLKYGVGVSYIPRSNMTFSLFWQRQNSDILNPDTAYLLSNNALPPNLDYENDKIGVRLDYRDVDYRFLPRKGWTVGAGVLAGFKTIKKNNELLEYDSETYAVNEYYEALGLKQDQYQFDVNLAGYLPFWKRFGVKLETSLGWIINENSLLENELYRLGGAQSLRGFDEEFFRAGQYSISVVELRFFLNQNSFF